MFVFLAYSELILTTFIIFREKHFSCIKSYWVLPIKILTFLLDVVVGFEVLRYILPQVKKYCKCCDSADINNNVENTELLLKEVVVSDNKSIDNNQLNANNNDRNENSTVQVIF